MRPMEWRPTIVYALSRSRNIFLAFLCTFFALAAALRAKLGDGPTASSIHGGANANEGSESAMADIVAYNALALVFAVSSGVLGLRAWLGPASDIGGSPMSRMYAPCAKTESLCVLTAGYELFNLIGVVVLPEYRSLAFVGHHATTFLLGIMSLHPWCHYYSSFFFGVASVSSIPLCLGELLAAAALPQLAELCKPPFVLLFLALRTAYWPYVSIAFWEDSLWALSKPRERVHAMSAYITLLSANIFLTTLQFVWTHQIVTAIGEML